MLVLRQMLAPMLFPVSNQLQIIRRSVDRLLGIWFRQITLILFSPIISQEDPIISQEDPICKSHLASISISMGIAPSSHSLRTDFI
jgi:hypothetical protein